jgi:hypothetical protein
LLISLPQTTLNNNHKLDITTLEGWLWEAACKIRGEIDAPKYKDYILPLIFLKRLSDVFDDEVKKLEGKYGRQETIDALLSEDERQFGGVKKTRVNRVFTQPKKKMLFLFDYGDEWHFRVELTTIEPAQRGKPYPVCIKSVGKARTQYDEPDEIEELSRIDDDEDNE